MIYGSPSRTYRCHPAIPIQENANHQLPNRKESKRGVDKRSRYRYAPRRAPMAGILEGRFEILFSQRDKSPIGKPKRLNALGRPFAPAAKPIMTLCEGKTTTAQFDQQTIVFRRREGTTHTKSPISCKYVCAVLMRAIQRVGSAEHTAQTKVRATVMPLGGIM